MTSLRVIEATNSPAMAAAFRRIERECNPHVLFKERMRNLIANPGTRAAAARYGSRAQQLRYVHINNACRFISAEYRDAKRAYGIAVEFGLGDRLSLNILRELRLILRWLRFTSRAAVFPAVAEEIARRAA